MKNTILYLFAILTIGIFIVGCDNLETFESSQVTAAPTATLAVSEVADSTFTLDISTDKAGYLAYLVTSDTSRVVTAIGILSNAYSSTAGTAAIETFKLESAKDVVTTIGGLMPNSYYKVYAVSSNTDGVESEVASFLVKTDDGVGPSFVSSTPEKSNVDDKEADLKIVLTFDEPIDTALASKFTFTYFFEGKETKAESALVNKDNPFEVIVTQSHNGLSGDYIFLAFEEGAVIDLSQNPINEALVSGNDDDGLFGLYWRISKKGWTLDPTKFTPKNGSAVEDPDFIIEFKAPVAVKNNAKDGSIKLIVVGAGVKSIYEVPAANITLGDDKKTIQVEKPFTPTYGEMIYIEIKAGTFTDNFGNPNIVIESGIDGIAGADDPITKIGWLISYGYTIDMVIGNYTFNGINHPNPDYGTDKSFDVEIVADPENDDQVLILGFYGSKTPIPAVFNGDFATLTVTPPEDDFLLGDIFDDGGETYFWSDDAEVFVLNIQANGDLITDPAYFLDVYWVSADESEEGFVNVFVESTWTKLAGGEGKAKGNNIIKSKPINKISKHTFSK